MGATSSEDQSPERILFKGIEPIGVLAIAPSKEKIGMPPPILCQCPLHE